MCARWSLHRKVTKMKAFVTGMHSPRRLNCLVLHVFQDRRSKKMKVTFTVHPIIRINLQHQQMLYVNVTLQQKPRMGGGGRVQHPWFWWRRACRRGLGRLMSPEHQDPIRSSERLGGVGQGAGCQGGIWLWVSHRLICWGESCDPCGRLCPPVSTEV